EIPEDQCPTGGHDTSHFLPVCHGRAPLAERYPGNHVHYAPLEGIAGLLLLLEAGELVPAVDDRLDLLVARPAVPSVAAVGSRIAREGRILIADTTAS